MTKDEITALAKKAIGDYSRDQYWPFFTEDLVRFAESIEARTAAAQAQQIAQYQANDARWRYVAHTLGEYCVVDALDNTIGVLKGAALDAVVDAAMKEKTP